VLLVSNAPFTGSVMNKARPDAGGDALLGIVQSGDRQTRGPFIERRPGSTSRLEVVTQLQIIPRVASRLRAVDTRFDRVPAIHARTLDKFRGRTTTGHHVRIRGGARLCGTVLQLRIAEQSGHGLDRVDYPVRLPAWLHCGLLIAEALRLYAEEATDQLLWGLRRKAVFDRRSAATAVRTLSLPARRAVAASTFGGGGVDQSLVQALGESGTGSLFTGSAFQVTANVTYP
jgi:hypothetical protein